MDVVVQVRSVAQGHIYVNTWFPVGGVAWEVLEPLEGGAWLEKVCHRSRALRLQPRPVFLLSEFCVWMKMRSASLLLVPPCFPYLHCQDRVYPPGTGSQNCPFLLEAAFGLGILSRQHKNKLKQWINRKNNFSPWWHCIKKKSPQRTRIWNRKLILQLLHCQLTH